MRERGREGKEAGAGAQKTRVTRYSGFCATENMVRVAVKESSNLGLSLGLTLANSGHLVNY